MNLFWNTVKRFWRGSPKRIEAIGRSILARAPVTDDEVVDAIRSVPRHFIDILVDLKNLVTIGQSIAPVSNNATATGTGVDCENGDVRTHAIISTGVVTGSYIYTIQMQESTDNSTWTNIADPGALSANVTAAGIKILSFQRTKRYVTALLTKVSGTSAIVDVMVLTMKKQAPVGTGYDRSPSS
jgi:hypothetical protein